MKKAGAHPNVIKYIDDFVESDRLSIIMEYCPGIVHCIKNRWEFG